MKDYSSLGELLSPSSREATVQFLKSIDSVVAAHRNLQKTAESRFGMFAYRAWNIGDIENNLGIFSRNVTIINQTFDGDRATVTLQEADRVPLIRARFVKSESRWFYVGEPIGESALTALADLATAIDGVATSLGDGMSAEDYHQAVVNTLVPGMIRVARGSQIDDAIRVTNAAPVDEASD